MDNDNNVVVVDIGNVFDNPGLQGQLKAEVAIRAMQLMPYDLLNLGSSEFNYGNGFLDGGEFLCTQTSEFTLPTISANVVYKDTGEPVTDSHRIKDFGDFKVGFVGVVSKEYETTILDANRINARDIEVLDEVNSVSKEVSALRNEVDILVVLADMDVDTCATLVSEVGGIDVIICGEGNPNTPEPQTVNGVLLVRPGPEGQHIGNLAISLDYNYQIKTVDNRIVALDSSISDQQEDILLILDSYYACLESFKGILLDIDQVDPPEGGSYIGYSVCRQCHPDQHEQWDSTVHAEAFATIKGRSQDYNPECIPCHTTGFGYTGGFVTPDLTSEMEGVQCETCHGDGTEHSNDPGRPLSAVSEATCTSLCHTPEQSPEFDYPAYYLRVTH
jgi:hypothetical protein